MKRVYLQANKDVDAAITELERLQPIQLESANSPSRTSFQTEERSTDNGAIDAEIRNEMNGLEQRHQRAMQKMKNNAANNIDLAIDLLKNCKTNREAKTVLENLLSCTLGRVFSAR